MVKLNNIVKIYNSKKANEFRLSTVFRQKFGTVSLLRLSENRVQENQRFCIF